ncbi:MAG: hypothetical protein GXO21_08285 [Aquificae bacterium]|nr:hypothetical protein [Aquificota bacterium]
MTDFKKEDIELKKIEVEKLKWLEGIFRTLFLALIADIGGVSTLLLKTNAYETIHILLIVLGISSIFALAFAVLMVLIKMQEIYKKLEE